MSKKVFCNICGKELDIFDKQQRFHLEGRLGYGSKYDGDEIDLDVCNACIDKLIESCSLSPVVVEED